MSITIILQQPIFTNHFGCEASGQCKKPKLQNQVKEVVNINTSEGYKQVIFHSPYFMKRKTAKHKLFHVFKNKTKTKTKKRAKS